MKRVGWLILLISLGLLMIVGVMGWARRITAFESAWILYSADYDGQYRIYRTLANGKRTEALTPAKQWAALPTWSPDGSAFAYGTYSQRTGKHIINRFDIKSRTSETLVGSNTIGIASWSSDGTMIAYIGENYVNLYVLTIATQQTETIVMQTGIRSVGWSPDSTWLVYVGDYQTWREVYRVRRDGSQRERLTTLRAGIDRAVWSPTAATIVFSTTVKHNWDIYQLEVDTWQVKPLTSLWIHEVQPNWSPTGEWIVFTENRTGRYHLSRMKADGSSTRRISQGIGDEQSPSWGPLIDLKWHPKLWVGAGIGGGVFGAWMKKRGKR